MYKIDLKSVINKQDPAENIQNGLVTSSDKPIPLRSVDVRAELVDLASKVCPLLLAEIRQKLLVLTRAFIFRKSRSSFYKPITTRVKKT